MSRVKTAFHDEICGASEGEWERVADELMDDYLGLRIEVSRLRDRLRSATCLLADWDEWEGGVILDGTAWTDCGGFQVEGEHFHRYLELQGRRQGLRSTASSTEAKALPEALYVQLSDDGSTIRKWSRDPFEGGTRFDCRGTFAPVGGEAHREPPYRVRVERTCTDSNDWGSA